MKKIIMMAVMFLFLVNVTGCGSSSAKPEDTQKKIEDAGWKIELQKNPGTEVIYYLYLNDGDDTQISINRYKEDDQASLVSFIKKSSSDNYVVDYVFDKKAFIGMISSKSTYDASCLGYNLSDNKESTDSGEMGKCSDSEIKTLTDVQKEFEDTLSENDLTTEDLRAWAEWYYENN